MSSGGGRRRAGLFLVAALCAQLSRADDTHYRSVLIGERATGMAGAFAAISDDPSGAFYNPAGMVFGMENYFNLSANAYSVSTQRYKSVVAGQDYVMRSQGLIPAFFGFNQNLGRAKLAFTILVPNADLYDQDDELSNISSTANKPNKLVRRFFRQNTTYLFGPSYAREVFNNFTIGLSAFIFARLDKSIDNQFILYNPVPTGTYLYQNTYLNRGFYGFWPRLGLQWMPLPKYSMGLTIARPINVGGTGTFKQIQSTTDASGNPVAFNGQYGNDVSFRSITNLTHDIPEVLSFDWGNAYFFTKEFLITADLEYFFGANSPGLDYAAQPVWNVSIGTEYYVTENFPIRAGFFTDRSNTPPVDPTKTNQFPHVDLIGGTLSLSWVKPGSSFSLATSYSWGSGKAQIIQGTATQDLEMKNITVYINGSYQL